MSVIQMEEKNMKRFALVMILSFAVLAAGFAQGKSETAIAENGENVVTVRWLMQVSSAEEKRQWQELADDVSKVYPNIKVELNTTDWNGYWTKLPTEFAGGNPSDILYMQSMKAKDYLKAGFLPITKFVNEDQDIDVDDFQSGMLDALSMDGELYCLPYDFGPGVLFYNIDLFDKCSLPYPDTWKSWEDFINACKTMKKNGVKCISVAPLFGRLYSFIMGNGAYLLAEDGTVRVNTPKFIEAIQAMDDLIQEGYTTLESDTGNVNWDREQFYSGNSAILSDGVWILTNVKTKSNFKYGVSMVVPGMQSRKTFIAGSGFGISKGTKHPEEAYLALKVITSKASEKKLAEWGRALPARASVRDVYYDKNEELNGLKEIVEASLVPEIGIPEITPQKWTQVEAVINQNLESVFLGNIKAAEALNTAQKEINRILGQN
jgi:ABC-type glycerol-3-phosphate transport system substrate-binding protein